MTKTQTRFMPPGNCRWQLSMYDMIYDGGHMSSLGSSWYRTKLGAYLVMYWRMYVASWGGYAELYDYKKQEVVKRIYR